MLRLTFRTKLLLAMMLVVAGVCTATLLVTQRRVQANYERMFRGQFKQQIGYFTSLQDARLESVKEECLKLAQSVRFIGIMNEPEINATDLYQTATNELRGVLNPFDDAADLHRRRGPGRLQTSFYRFMDAQGKPIFPPENFLGRHFNPALSRWVAQRFGLARDALASPEVQQVAYLPLPAQTNQFGAARVSPMRGRGMSGAKIGEGGPLTLQEIIITKIIDPADNRTLGGLVLGFPLPDLVPQAKGRVSETRQPEVIQTGILIEEQLFASPLVIPDSLGAAAAALINQRLREQHETRADFGCELEGASYRIFFELMNEHSAFPAAYQVCLYPMDAAQREQAALRWIIIAVGAAALTAAFALSLIISHGLSAPIRELVAGTGEVQRGNFAVRVLVRRRDELGQLASSFNEMADGLAQKERYRTVLNMFADERIARRLVAGELTLGGELREVSVLFCDIRGFTALTENMPPGDVIEMLNEHMSALVRVLKEYDGLLDKFVGDLLMAIFGAPLKYGQDTVNAARCALRLIEVRDALNKTSRHQLRIGIGIATGTVVAGCMGTADRVNYTVLGERVNLASRLCDRAGAGEILVDENTHRKLGGILCSMPTGEIHLKGFAAPVPAFRLSKVNG